MKVTGKHVVYAFVLLVAGFILAFSYQYTKEEQGRYQPSEKQWQKEDELRNEILTEQETNSRLTERLEQLQDEVHQIEQSQAEQEQVAFNLVEDLEKLRMLTGNVMVKGPGITVSLADSSYVPEDDNPNHYIVHEQHIQKVIYELFITGAEAIAINGQRLAHNSYILCIGPVVEVDGNQYFAPFEISAIGDPDTLASSLELKGNIKDQLVQEGIEVGIEKKNEIIMEPIVPQ